MRYRRYRRRARIKPFSTTLILVILFSCIAAFGLLSLQRLHLGTLPTLFLVMGFLGAGLLVVFTALLFIKKVKDTRFKNITLFKVDQMTGVEFEEFVAYLFESRGYRIKTTPVSGDLGVDLIATKDHERIAIQVKRYTGAVGRSAISDAVAGMAQYKCSSCAVVTNSYFTKIARQLAYSNRCELVDRDTLSRMIIRLQQTEVQKRDEETLPHPNQD